MFSTLPNIEFSFQSPFATQMNGDLYTKTLGQAGSGTTPSLSVTEADQVYMGQRAAAHYKAVQGAKKIEFLHALSKKDDNQALELISNQMDVTLANREATIMTQKLSSQLRLMNKIQQNLST